MDERIEIDLNGKLKLPLRLLRATVVAARTGWSDRLAAGQFLKIVDPCGKQAGDFWAFNAADPAEDRERYAARINDMIAKKQLPPPPPPRAERPAAKGT